MTAKIPSNTAKKQGKGFPPKEHQFTKGDPRINKNGRPRKFDQLRAFALDKLEETARDANGKPVLLRGQECTNLEWIVEKMMRDPKQTQHLLEVAYGKVPNETNVSLSGGIEMRPQIDLKRLTNEELKMAIALEEKAKVEAE